MIRTLIVFAIMIPGLAAATLNRFAALLLYVWFALFRPQEWVWFDISFLRLSMLTGALLVLPSLATGILPNVTHPLSAGIIGFMVAGILSALHATRPAIAWEWVEFFIRLSLVCLLAVTIVSDKNRFRLLVAVIAGSLGFHAAKAGLNTILEGGVRYAEGLAGAWVDNNGYAVGMVTVTPLILATAQNFQHIWIKRVFWLAVPLTVLSVISTFSRGGFLSLCMGSLTLVMLQKRRLPALVAMGVLAVPVAMFMASQEGYLDRLSTIRTYEERGETSAMSRIHFWEVAIDMAVDHPLGVGFFNYEPTYNAYDFSFGLYGTNRSVHNSHLQALSEAGFLGAAVWVGLFVYAFVCAFRIRRRGMRSDLPPDEQRMFTTYGNAFIASMAGFLTGGTFIAMMLNDLTWLIFAAIASLDRISKACCDAADAARAAGDQPATATLAEVPVAAAAATPAAARPTTWVPPSRRLAGGAATNASSSVSR